MVAGLAAAAAVLSACGQRGALFLPADPAAAQRATLPQLLIPGGAPATDAAPAPAAASSAPAGNGATR